MAKLTALPSLEVIDGFRGVLDFYVYLGIPVVRKWPRKIGPHRSPGVKASWPAFTYLAHSWELLSPSVIQAYENMAVGGALTAKDWYFRLYLSTDYWGAD